MDVYSVKHKTTDDPKLPADGTYTYPFTLYILLARIRAFSFFVFPIPAILRGNLRRNTSAVMRASREARRVAAGRRSLAGLYPWNTSQTEKYRGRRSKQGVYRRESDGLCLGEWGLTAREEERSTSERGTIDRHSGKQRGFPVYRLSSSAPCTTTPTLSTFFHPPPSFSSTFLYPFDTLSASFTVAPFLS